MKNEQISFYIVSKCVSCVIFFKIPPNQRLISLQSLQQTQCLLSARSSLTLRTKRVQEIKLCACSDQQQMSLIPAVITLKEAVPKTLKRALRDSHHRIVPAASLRTSAPLMLETISVLWQNVQRHFVETDRQLTVKVTASIFCLIKKLIEV